MTTATKVHVQIGEVKTGGPGELLTAILGSCIGLGLLYPSRQIYGLAHCLLSNSGQQSDEISGRYVDQALKSMISLMKITPDDYRKIKAIVVGGANMTMPADTEPSRLVGSINSTTAYKAVRKQGFRNIYEDIGGVVGRQITIDCTTGEFTVAEIPRFGG
ncbi:chemotaxis protein CheD [Tropicibacter naphthalenivorans]|uniref:Probable chemoreceptor glutamine deamidase CheD n=1 Tax=Tropicibacter naphthalenivorans TaxID=441103 RepID=A0A0P1GGK7_9RHOB|nr:chemotaxis protein CheD [Tropicibacter naphthalenivorans]CUH80743.1 Chemoreceptor glutamine deamidase CheD [Tropicibacter naphthalenivorans]SMC89908.1 chemotaxis protein CheD [Tropicibacter naphthalenivorans]